MGFWTILLKKPSQCLCTIILPWGKYCYLHLPTGLTCSPDIYQEKISEVFIIMTFVIVYKDNILVLTSGSFDDHLRQLENVFEWLHHNNLQVNAKKSNFCTLETKYLGFILMREGIKWQQKRSMQSFKSCSHTMQSKSNLLQHAEQLQSHDSLPLPHSNTAHGTYQEDCRIQMDKRTSTSL
jgi:hypothetical protein